MAAAGVDFRVLPRPAVRSVPAAWREAALALLVSRALVWSAELVGLGAFGSHVAGAPRGVPGWISALGLRWDAMHYHVLAQHGYPGAGMQGGENWAFFPGYPALVALCGGSWLAGLLLSTVTALMGLWAVLRVGELTVGPAAARRGLWLLALFPASLFLTAFYSEGLFLACSAGAVLAALEERWALAGVLAFACALTRSTGLLVAVPLAVIAWSSPRRARGLAAAAGAPLGLAAWLAYAAGRAGDWLAPVHAEKVWGRGFHGPVSGLWYAFGSAWHALGHLSELSQPGQFEPPWMKVALLVLVLAALVPLAGAWRELGPGLGLYAVLAFAAPLSSVWPAHPLASLPRYLLVLFPLFLWLGTRRRAFPWLLGGFAAVLALLSGMFGAWVWVA